MYPTLNYFLQLTRNMKNVYSFICALTLPFFTNKRQSCIIVFEVKESMVIFGFCLKLLMKMFLKSVDVDPNCSTIDDSGLRVKSV